jgi:hypothetical protein
MLCICEPYKFADFYSWFIDLLWAQLLALTSKGSENIEESQTVYLN